MNAWAVGRVDLGLSEPEFWSLVPREYRALVDRHTEQLKLEDLRFGQLASLVANVAGSKKPDGTRFVPYDFFPSLIPTGRQQLAAPGLAQEAAVAAAWNQWGLRAQGVAARRAAGR
jgi:hypothetical protein